ncbi:hypothetical protein FSP39_001766 [Pinctada imbricata]|uniref:RING-type domain-containing protein n=1 Tax=Pinctada imbricata TaxID=66713 RepID=A0AA89BMQ4_PINIB|nr:hypothetical protein FSP39_001766 [Pinctada imbricata]
MSDTCSVCQDIFKAPKLLLCGHTFCRQCIDDIIKSSTGSDVLKCPLCRKLTKRPKDGAEGLIDNFFVADRKYLSRILQCTNCHKVEANMKCTYCSIQMCEECMYNHKKIGCSVKKMDNSPESDEMHGDNETTVELLLRLEEQLLGTGRTKYCFELEHEISVNLDSDEEDNDENINLSCISCFDGKNCIIAPNGERLEIIWTQQLLPYGLSSLNNGRVVFVGTVEGGRHGGMSIFEYSGKLVTEMTTVNGEYLLEFPREVSVNMKTNDIYVGDVKKGQVILFKEDCSYVSSYEKLGINIFLGDGLTSEAVRGRNTFPFAITFSQCSELLFAGYISEVDCSIHILSATLDFLGFVSSPDSLGNPAGLSCDDRGRLYIGDGADGIIRVFRLSNYVNKL